MHLLPFLAALLAWSVLWIVASLIALWRTEGRAGRRGFWFMSGLWCAVNTGVVAWSLLDPPADADALRRLLAINGALDVGYLIIGAALLTRPTPMLRGFGLAIVVQGLFLLAFDLAWIAAL